MVGLSGDRLKATPHELSGGQRQRVMIALALAPRAPGRRHGRTDDGSRCRDAARDSSRRSPTCGIAWVSPMIFITHDLSLLIELADEIAVMYAGRMVERAPADSLFTAPRHPYTFGLLNSFPPMHGARRVMTGIPGSPPDLRAVPSGCPFHPRCPHVMDRCRIEEPQLVAIGPASRQVACWLHAPGIRVPVELSRRDPAPWPAAFSAGAPTPPMTQARG